MLKEADTLDSRGRVVEAAYIDKYAQKISTGGFGGGTAEYVSKLLELAKNKGIDYMQSRMEESRIVTLNDGTPIVKQNDPSGFINAVVTRARQLNLPETKGKKPFAPGKIDARWNNESEQREKDIMSGKSSWLDKSKPYSDAIAEKKLKKYQWNPSGTKTETKPIVNSKPAVSNKPTAENTKSDSNPVKTFTTGPSGIPMPFKSSDEKVFAPVSDKKKPKRTSDESVIDFTPGYTNPSNTKNLS
jgi:hypothetical protein